MFLENFSLIVLKTIVTGETFVDEEEDPGKHDIDDEEVDENWGHVSVPGGVEIGVESQSAELEEIFNVGWDGRQDRDVVVWSEPEYISVDQHGHKDRIEYQENRVDKYFNCHSWRFRCRPDTVNQFSYNNTKQKVSNGWSSNDSVLYTLSNENAGPVLGASSLNSGIRKRSYEIGVAVTLNDRWVIGSCCRCGCWGDGDIGATAGMWADVNGTKTNDGTWNGQEY